METYYLWTNSQDDNLDELYQWFNDSKTWIECADSIAQTAFLFVAENCYWQAYLRDKTSRYALENVITCFRKSNRLDKAEAVVEAAYSMNYWNLFTRDLLLEVENGTKWQQYFELEEVMICKVQNMYRGYLARKDFLKRIKQVMKEEEEEAAWEEEQQKDPEVVAKNIIIKEKAAALLSNNLRSRFITWKIYVKDCKQKRIDCSIVLQKYARR